jgi:hypothetical protein
MEPLKATRIRERTTFHRRQKWQGVKDSLGKQFKAAQHEHLPMEKLGSFVRADKSQAKGTKFLFVYNKIDKPTESLKV